MANKLVDVEKIILLLERIKVPIGYNLYTYENENKICVDELKKAHDIANQIIDEIVSIDEFLATIKSVEHEVENECFLDD